MIGRLTGLLAEKNPPQIVLDVHGVGYELDVPMSTFYNLPGTGEKATLLTHFAVREEGHYLYGFLSESERFAFRQLLKISGIGARTALSVLSGLSVADLAAAVARQEVGRLIKVPGIGKKTAERLLLELKGKLAETSHVALPAVDDASQDILNALIALGYNEREAASAMKQLPAGVGTSDGIRQALKLLSKSLSMFSEDNPKRLAQTALVALLIVGCIAVLLPMIGAVLFAFVLWICTWRLYAKQLLPRIGHRHTLGATLMTLVLTLFLLLPTTFLAGSIASNADVVIDEIQPYIEQGLPPRAPKLLRKIPVFGREIDSTWQRIATNKTEQSNLIKQFIDPLRRLAVSAVSIIGNGLLQIALVLFVGFFLFRDGQAVSKTLHTAAIKLGGELGEKMLDMTRGTVIGVMLGIVGTAAAQATATILGLLLCGVPGAVLLGFATFFLSMIPIGPPLVWGGAAAWLYSQGETGWAIFLVLYGIFVISSIDNFLKPILMSKGSGVSILLIGLGVLGGLLVFGFIGIFLGPVLLALAHMLLRHWTQESHAA